jgi:hypothetical protein
MLPISAKDEYGFTGKDGRRPDEMESCLCNHNQVPRNLRNIVDNNTANLNILHGYKLTASPPGGRP